jgi:hypothetical protein
VWLNVGKFPQATFQSSAIKAAGPAASRSPASSASRAAGAGRGAGAGGAGWHRPARPAAASRSSAWPSRSAKATGPTPRWSPTTCRCASSSRSPAWPAVIAALRFRSTLSTSTRSGKTPMNKLIATGPSRRHGLAGPRRAGHLRHRPHAHLRHLRGAALRHVHQPRPLRQEHGHRGHRQGRQDRQGRPHHRHDGISTGVVPFDAHLKGADFFDVANHPTARFVGEQFVFDGDKVKEVSGQLTLRGKTAPITLKACASTASTTPCSSARSAAATSRPPSSAACTASTGALQMGVADDTSFGPGRHPGRGRQAILDPPFA